ncbi:ABC transporter permease [Geodermatophilus ruber]|uniref:ABC-type nitrate/sulfonate/bicarbonate transport system, permease component n=1 Tax=Geodermatophilus ruber TaxID=504800 RepID=A0A1I4I540_9ACTN|nr:ABC transporter permease subunit [Geodermatophilus ruber]SFL49237.1 ABC-type nitrate/sulfonate/bicarbonate transport system, permease component [Geodermatophilus ruber]
MTDTLTRRRSTEEIARSRPAWQRRLTSDRAARLTFYVVAFLFWIALAGLFERIPGPPSVVDSLVEEFRRGEVFGNFADTFYRFGIGVALSVGVGILVGVVIGLSPMARAFLESPVLVGLSIPAIMWAFLTVMWFGFGHTSPIVTTFLTAVPFVILNVAQGVQGVSRDLRDMSSSYGVPLGRRVRELVLPAVAGYVVAGLRFAVIMGWNGVLLAEWFGGSGGAGYRARFWYDANQFAGFAAWVVLFVGVIIILDQLLLERLSRRMFRWRDATH